MIAEEMWPEITSFIRTVLKETVEAVKHHVTPGWEGDGMSLWDDEDVQAMRMTKSFRL